MKDYPVPIVVDKEAMTVTAGNFTKGTFCQFPRSRKKCLSQVHKIKPGLRLPGPTKEEGCKEAYQLVAKEIGTGFWDAWNRAMWWLWVGEHKELVNKLCRGLRGRYVPRKLELFHKHKGWLYLAQADGCWNIAPFILELGMYTQDLKELFGKGLWKALCSNSFSRNKLLAEQLGSARHYLNEKNKDMVERLKILNSYPTSYLSKCLRIDRASQHICRALTKSKKLTKTSKHEIRESLFYTFADTRRMALQLGEVYSEEWSLDKVYAKHEEFVAAINAQKYSDKPFAVDPCWKKQVVHGDYTATLLDSPRDFHNEGKAMHHCVASYLEYAQRGDCQIYSIKKNGQRISTLEMSPSGYIKQHQGPCNEQVPVEHKEAIDVLVAKIQEGLAAVRTRLEGKVCYG